jgi:hypothetical protein
MMTEAQAVAPIDDAEFRARSMVEGRRLVLHFWGNADMRAKSPLDAFLAAADGKACAAAVEEVVVDLRELVFMNSSCLKALVTWLATVQERPAAERYLIRFLKEPAAHWQVRSLHALAAFAPDIVQIE